MISTLNGLRVLNTRPEHQAQLLTQSILQAGGKVVLCPTLQVIKTNKNWIHTLPDLNEVHQAIFISANAVHFCFSELLNHKICWPASIQVIAIGKASAHALKHYKIQVDELPENPNSEHVLHLNSLQQIKGQSVLLFKGTGGRQLIEEELNHRGAHLIALSVYQRIMPQMDQQFIHSIWHKDLVDIILITSEQSLHNLFKMFGQKAHSWLLKKPYVVFSERLAHAARLYGIKVILISHPDKIMQTLFDYAQGLIND